jgi:acyl transferase domain-containing protein
MPDSPLNPRPAADVEELSATKRALVEIRTLRARLEELESARQASRREPIAIVGAGMRFPGGVIDAQSFWNLLAEGRDAITEIPRERWDWRSYFHEDADAPGSAITRHGGFLNGVDRFDAAFFGISPREAAAMDPQHRLVLEVAWEALENAGHSPVALQGTRSGVFLGIANNDYGRAAMADLDGIDAYTGSGNSPGMVAGRLSYVLGLHGPSLAIDTSCSSSLVAVHLACAALLTGECDVALAGGVNLILTPESNIALSKAHMMARDGRCKTFDEAADGYVRSEGCCVVVLRKLSDAFADGDRILAVIRGSAVNHDGRSGGLTAPNGPAQAAVIRQALESAGIKPSQIGFVETHGTGTALGDPIEVETLAAVMGIGRTADNPLAVGAVKTNIGHAEAASGIAGLMKAVLALQHRQIPPSLHLVHKNSRIDWDRLPVQVATQLAEWDSRKGRRYAGVSSFGFSGTNAHVVLEEAPAVETATNALERRSQILTISAKTQTSLDRLCAAYAAALRNCPAEELANLCFTANAGRAHFAHRVAVVGDSAEQMAMELERAGRREKSTRLFTGDAEDSEPQRIGFLFTGQGSQYAGMGRELVESSPVFRSAMERCAAAYERETGGDLISVLYPDGSETNGLGMEQARVAQPALFALEFALAEMWRSWGIEPSVLLGHSLGEYVAAVVAGIFRVEDGMRLVCARARLMETLTEPGAMRAVSAPVARVQQAIAGHEKEISIAAVNAPQSVVISGRAERIEEIAGKLEAGGIRTRALPVTHAFHSPLLQPILEEFERIAGGVEYHAPKIRIISNLTGKAARPGEMSIARYWREHMRGTVLFDAGLRSALDTGCRTWIEIGPQPHLMALAAHADASPEYKVFPSMRRSRGDWAQVLETLASLYVRGQKIDWDGFDRGRHRRRLELPTYPFERQRYWLAESDANGSQTAWQRTTQAALSQSKLAPIGFQLEGLGEKWKTLHRLTIAEILKTFREFDAFAKAGTSHTAESMVAECGISAAQTRLMARWLNLLRDEGFLERDGKFFVNRAPLPRADLDEAWASAWRQTETSLRDDPYLLEYLRNCSKHLKDVLIGKTSPLETLFPGGSPELATNLYENSGGARYANLIVASAVQASCLAAPANRRVRILELGGGTGATTSAILPQLAGRRISYRFTDVSEVFLHRANARFASYPFVEYGLLDIENAEHLGRYAHFFDIVVAANVVHATRDLPTVLRGIANLLTAGGTLVLLETTAELAWHEITTGLIEGWQKSEDELRGDRALMGADAWDSALREAGFEEVLAVPEADSPASDLPLRVILARGPSRADEAESMLNPDVVKRTASDDIARFEPGVEFHSVNSMESTVAELLRDAPSSERHPILLGIVCDEIVRVLRLPAGTVPKKRDRLMDLGMDSLMAVELRNGLATRLSVDNLPATLIFDYPTPDAIASYLMSRMSNTSPAATELSTRQQMQKTFLTPEEVADLSDEDVATLLRSHLSQ